MPKVVIIAGPTASGKSALAIDVACALNSAVINCDSMQIYKNIPVISAAPSAEERAKVEHRLYEIFDCSKRGNVVEWLDLCVAEIKKLWNENKVPIVVGGTGMYIDALINGVTPIPEVPVAIREKVQIWLEKDGLPALYSFLEKHDKEIAIKLNPNDKTRIVRAVEIMTATGKKVSEWYKVTMVKKLPEAEFIIVKIMPAINVIEERCKQRLDKMVYEQGALKEIEYLVAHHVAETMPAMKALGVPELTKYVIGKVELPDALAEAKLHTRQYAKRQRTWLRNKLNADIVFEDVYSGQNEFLEKILMRANA